jgi:hypothetical protein
MAAVGIGMRGKDLQKLMMVARDYNVIILVRHTNAASLKYIGQPGYYPKPAICKGKTADENPKPLTRLTLRTYDIAGLVVHPGFHPTCYSAEKLQKARKAWDETMEHLAPTLRNVPVDPLDKASCARWGVDRVGVGPASRWSWRIDVDPNSPRFGCIQLKNADVDWSYIHGDYDLKDVIIPGREDENLRRRGMIDGVKNNLPDLHGIHFKTIQTKLNALMGADMVQHGSEAQFAWHSDEPITVAFQNWTYRILANAAAVQSYYEELKRDILAKTGTDYLRNPDRAFHYDPVTGKMHLPRTPLR